VSAVSRKKGIEESSLLVDDPLWYRDAVIYELHVRAFQDSNGDGIGDFRGLVDRLDYLQDLGVTALWLLPFYPSPLRDDGYDIADYTNVNPIYGTRADFKLFLKEAHRRGLRVITELVVNHTSDQHPWFQRARRARPGSSERDFYVWSNTADRYREARIIFKDFEPSNWAWDPVAQSYYWHRFYGHQPDLNFDNPEVPRAIFQVLDFWLGMGIDGLRLDAVPYLYERDGTNCENLPETHAFLRDLRRHVDQNFKNRMLLAEANQWPEDSVAYFGRGDECHMAFHFPVMPRLFMALRMEDRLPVIDILQQTPAIPDNSQWALFLRNHDELTLEMVTDEDRDYMYRVYAQDLQMRINLGIRRRLAPLLENHRGKIELLNGLLLSLPGTPVLYYGDEIGMGDNIYLGDRNGVRTPMQWSAERNAGFSRANPQRLYTPVIIDPEYHYEAINVESQQKSPHSLLWWMKHLLALRKRFKAFGRGSLEFLYPDNHKVLAFVRRYPVRPAGADGNGRPIHEDDECLLVVANLSRFTQYVELDLSPFRGMVPVEVLGRTPFPPVGELPYLLTLGPYAFYWFQLRPQRVLTLPAVSRDAPLPTLDVPGDWENVFQGKARQALEEILPAYLKRCPWFTSKARLIEEAAIRETVPLPGKNVRAQVTLVRVKFGEGDHETYAFPLSFAGGEQAEQLRSGRAHAVLCRLRVRGKEREEGVLFDAVEERAFAEALLQAIARKRRFKGTAGTICAWPAHGFAQMRGPAGVPLVPEVVKGEESDTSMAFDARLFLKVYRRIEEGVSPELEVTRFLAERTTFTHFPPLAGAVEYQNGPGPAPEPLTLAILQGYVHNEGNAWRYTIDMLTRYFERVLTLPLPDPELAVPHRPLLDLVEGEVPLRVQEVLGPSLPAAGLLGQRTGELHVALASSTDDPHFAPEPFTTLYQRSLYQSARTQARRAFELLRKRLKDMPEAVAEDSRRILEHEEELLHSLRSIYEHKITAMRTRCHGDYHLGQVLYTGKDYVILDLEGDPDRPLSDRRRKRSALRDVATMLRSFHFATRSALRKGSLRPEDIQPLEPWARLWYLWVAVAFVKGYLAAARQGSFLPPTRGELAMLLDFSLLKRVVNELRYELENDTGRVTIPVRALLYFLQLRD
jgi:maltose alpha-D-glucosyltransferase/alpha-amylase